MTPLWLTGLLESLTVLIPAESRPEWVLGLVRGFGPVRLGPATVDVEAWVGRFCVWTCPTCYYTRTAPEGERLFGEISNHFGGGCGIGALTAKIQVRVRMRCRSVASGLGALATELIRLGGEVPVGLGPLGTNRADEWWLPAWIPLARLDDLRAWARCREVRPDESALTRAVRSALSRA